MPDALIRKKRHESEQEIVLRLLEHVETEDSVSQAGFAKQIGIAKGLANAYFNRCLNKGWIKLRQVPRQRYLYYLTPKGFAEKARLTAQFLSYSYDFYRDARADLVATMERAADGGHCRLGVLGTGELAEIAAIVSDEAPADIVGFVAKESNRKGIAGRPVVTSWSQLDNPDAALLAALDEVQAAHDQLRKEHPDVAIYVPRQLEALVWE